MSTAEIFQKIFFEAIFFNDLFSWISKMYSSIEYFSQNLQLNSSFLKDTKTTGVLFILYITVHVAFLFHCTCTCICWAVIILEIITIKYNTQDSARIQTILPEDKKFMCRWYSCAAYSLELQEWSENGSDKKHKNIVRCSLLLQPRAYQKSTTLILMIC